MNSSPTPSPTSLFNRIWPPLAYFLLALGVPSVLIASFYQFVTTHLWLTIILAVLYEILAGIVSFIGKVWQNLEGLWVERLAKWFDARIMDRLSPYRKQYCQYLYYQHRDFDVKGLTTQSTFTLELDQVFVELSIDPTPIHILSPNPISIPPQFREGSRVIWDYMTSPTFTHQHFAIIGPPGSGKTTLLKHMVLSLITSHKKHAHHHVLPQSLPILLFLRDHADAIVKAVDEQQEFSLVDALHAHLKKWNQLEPPMGWATHQLLKGRCLVLLDGLDEVASVEVRRKVVSWVQKQMVAYGNNRFIVTSRPFGYRSNPLAGVTVLEIQPYTDKQIENFTGRWYLANEMMSKQKDDPGVRMRAKADANELLKRLRAAPTLYEFAVNPLLLTMIATVHRYRGRLPGQRVALYAEICEVFLGKRQEAREQRFELSPAQMQLVLQPLAYYLMDKGKREFTLDEAKPVIEDTLKTVSSAVDTAAFLTLVENISGLLLEGEHGFYRFAHLTFQEYMTAVHIQREHLEAMLVAHVTDSWWHETIRLYCAIADATAIVAACIAGNPPSIPALVLAVECLQERFTIQPTIEEKLNTLLDEGIEDTDPERQHIAAEVLLARRLRKMMEIDEDVFIDTSYITCAEYQLFLDEQQPQGHYFQPYHWTSHHFAPGQGHAPVLGIGSSEANAFCVWLIERERSPWQYRLPESGELERLTDEYSIEKFPVGSGCWLRQKNGFVWLRGLTYSMRFDLDNVAGFPVRNFDCALDLNRDFATAHALDFDLANALALTLALDLNRANALDLARARAFNLVHSGTDAAARTRVGTKERPFVPSRRGKKSGAESYRIDIDACLDIYLDLSILEARIQGRLPAWEGILLVRERKSEEFSDGDEHTET